MRPVLRSVPAPAEFEVELEFDQALERVAEVLAPLSEAPAVAEVPDSACRYWICVAGREDWPALMPVWGLWLDGAIAFSLDARAIESADPGACAASVVQFRTDDRPEIVDGTLEAATDPLMLARFAEACEEKYGFDVDPADPNVAVYVLRPRDDSAPVT